jgi:tRNA dimethylallyltransferase
MVENTKALDALKNKLLVVGGLTSSGKTKAAIEIAQKFSGVLISCDSRQVFRHFDIGTGKVSGLTDYERLETKGITVYKAFGVDIYGYDLCNPDEKVNAFEFAKFARMQINDAWSKGRLPILVGGTGLYIKMVLDGADYSSSDPNLRLYLSSLDVGKLTEILLSENIELYKSLNQSDRLNPVRLVRAIEKGRSESTEGLEKLLCDCLYLYFIYPKSSYLSVVEKSIKQRLDEGFLDEAKGLVSHANHPAGSAIGYKEAFSYIKGEIDYNSFLSAWTKREVSYVKRQATWFKAQNAIAFDVKSENFKLELEKTVEKWLQ